MQFPDKLLPHDLLSRATLAGNEYAWPLEDIPSVIEVAEESNLVSVGGQLQFRFPSGGTCECYWVAVDTFQSVPSDLPWSERVERTAAAARSQFENLQRRYDFLAEGRSVFDIYLDEFESSGGNVNDAMCFVWYVEAEPEAAEQP